MEQQHASPALYHMETLRIAVMHSEIQWQHRLFVMSKKSQRVAACVQGGFRLCRPHSQVRDFQLEAVKSATQPLLTLDLQCPALWTLASCAAIQIQLSHIRPPQHRERLKSSSLAALQSEHELMQLVSVHNAMHGHCLECCCQSSIAGLRSATCTPMCSTRERCVCPTACALLGSQVLLLA
eukprot:scaffold15545_cov19-Tisochrysis_lutea.AAC.8